MAGISSEAAKGIAYPTNKYKYNGIEETKELGLSEYDAKLRILDPQIAVWWQVDPETENMEMWSPYASNYDNPILYKDPLGNEPECCGGLLGVLADIGDKIAIAVIGVAVGSLNTISGGTISTNPFGYRDALRGTDREGYDMAVFTGQVASMMPVPGGRGKVSEPATGVVEMVPVGGGPKIKVEIPVTRAPGFVPPASPKQNTSSSNNTQKISGERNRTGSASGTDNPFKKLKPDPNKPGNVLEKNSHTGKSVTKPAPSGYWEWLKSKK